MKTTLNKEGLVMAKAAYHEAREHQQRTAKAHRTAAKHREKHDISTKAHAKSTSD